MQQISIQYRNLKKNYINIKCQTSEIKKIKTNFYNDLLSLSLASIKLTEFLNKIKLYIYTIFSWNLILHKIMRVKRCENKTQKIFFGYNSLMHMHDPLIYRCYNKSTGINSNDHSHENFHFQIYSNVIIFFIPFEIFCFLFFLHIDIISQNNKSLILMIKK